MTDQATNPSPPEGEIKQLTIRPLEDEDCPEIAAIIGHFAAQAILLWRTPEDIAKHKESFLLGELEGEIVGCVALQDYGKGLYELRSLALAEAYWGKRYGSQLIQGALALARVKDAIRVFALTKRPELFVRNGFSLANRDDFPQKVWTDCQLCPKRDNCIETAVVHELST